MNNSPAAVMERTEPAELEVPDKKWSTKLLWLILAISSALVSGILAPQIAPSRVFQILFSASVFVSVLGARSTVTSYLRLATRVRSRKFEAPGLRLLATLPGLIFCGILGFILLGVLFWPVKHIANYNYALTTFGAVLVLFAAPPLYRWSQLLGHRLVAAPKWVRPVFLTAVLAVAFAIQLRLGYALQVMPGWDVGAVVESAFGVADGSMETIYEYFQTYPNNLTILVLLTRYSQAMTFLGVPSSELLFAAIGLNCFVLCFSIMLTYLCARRILNEGAAVFTLIPLTLYVVCSPFISIVYSDTLGMLFPVLLLYLYLVVKITEKRFGKIVLWISIGAVAAFGFNLKPTAAFAAVAIVAVHLIDVLVQRKNVRDKVLAGVGVVAAVVLGFVSSNAAIWADIKQQSYIGFDIEANQKSVPWTHFLAMGATGMGAFTQSDIVATLAITDPTVRYQHGLDLYAERVEQMGYPGYLQFLDSKAVWTFGDGSFHTWGEGPLLSQQDPFPTNDRISGEIQRYMWGNGEHFSVMTGIWQSSWLAILFLIVLALRARTSILFIRAADIMRWSLFALTLFLLFFETRSRYLYLYIPFFILLATLSLEALTSRAVEPRSVSPRNQDGEDSRRAVRRSQEALEASRQGGCKVA